MHLSHKSPSEETSFHREAFTLIEVLVAMAVLVLLVVMVSQLTNSASGTVRVSEKQVSADEQAQLVFSQLAIDFDSMVRRKDADVLFWKNDSGNDAMFFYTEGQGFYSGVTGNEKNASQLSFTGYRVTNRTSPASNGGYALYPNYVLDRVSRGLAWDGTAPSITSGESFLMFLPGVAVPDGKNVLSNKVGEFTIPNRNSSFAKTPPYDAPTEEQYTMVLADGVYRMEFCFQLKDGTLSNSPVLTTMPNSNLSATVPPKVTDDTSKGYVAGSSRWWDKTHQRGYLCISSAKGAAMWSSLGLGDVSSIIVALGILDHSNRKMIKPDTTAPKQIDRTTMAAMVAALPDSKDPNPDFTATPPKLIAQKWMMAINKGTFAKDSGDIPRSAAAQVRIYQRAFNLDSR